MTPAKRTARMKRKPALSLSDEEDRIKKTVYLMAEHVRLIEAQPGRGSFNEKLNDLLDHITPAVTRSELDRFLGYLQSREDKAHYMIAVTNKDKAKITHTTTLANILQDFLRSSYATAEGEE